MKRCGLVLKRYRPWQHYVGRPRPSFNGIAVHAGCDKPPWDGTQPHGQPRSSTTAEGRSAGGPPAHPRQRQRGDFNGDERPCGDMDGHGRECHCAALLQEVLGSSRHTVGSNDSGTIETMANLANLHRNMGDYDLALPLLEEARMRCRRVLGSQHTETHQRAGELGELLFTMGDLVAAEPLLRKAMQGLHGAEHRLARKYQQILEDMEEGLVSSKAESDKGLSARLDGTFPYDVK